MGCEFSLGYNGFGLPDAVCEKGELGLGYNMVGLPQAVYKGEEDGSAVACARLLMQKK